MKHPVQVMD